MGSSSVTIAGSPDGGRVGAPAAKAASAALRPRRTIVGGAVMRSPEIWTIGHSTRSIEDFIALLEENRLEAIADIRRMPASRRYPHFGRQALADALNSRGLGYE